MASSKSKHQVLDHSITRDLDMPRALSCMEGWLADLRIRNCSPLTLARHEQVIKRLISVIGDKKVHKIKPDDIRLYLASRIEKVAPSTADMERRTIHAFLNFCLEEGFIDSNPVSKMKPTHLPKKVIPLLSQDVIAKLLAACNDKTFLGARNKAIILTLLDTGVRRAELVSMTRRDLYKEAITIHGKGAKERFIKISPRTQKAIWRYMLFRRDNLDALWLTEERRPLRVQGLRMMIRRLANRAGLDGERISAHIFRHTFATQMLRLGVDERSVQILLGHSSSAMTKRYTEQFNSEDVLRLNQVSPVDAMGL